jgi:type IV secretion system protein VirB10
MDYRSAPLGVLPRQLPRWLLLAIAVVMIGIMALSGMPARSRPASTAPAAAATAIDPNQQRIEDYQRRIQEQTQRLAAEQAALQAAKEATSAQPEPPAAHARLTSTASSGTTASSVVDRPRIADRAESERTGRGDRSLFADSVAFRREPNRAPPSPSVAPVTTARAFPPDCSQTSAMPGAVAPVAPNPIARAETPVRPVAASPATSTVGVPPGVAPTAAGVSPATAPAGVTEPPSPVPTAAVSPATVRAPFASRTAPPSSTAEKTYRIPEGTILETVLTNRLDGTYAGPVNCLLTTAVYAPDHQHLLIPAGARVLGDARPVTTFGQVRLAVVFHRVLLPNGERLDLEAFHGLNQIGETGLRDQVDRHYAQIFGASLAVGAIAGLAQAQTSVGLDATAFDVYRQGAAANLAQSSARILDRFLNLLPTVTIREGHRIKVYLSNDLEVPAYRDRDAQPILSSRPTGGRS